MGFIEWFKSFFKEVPSTPPERDKRSAWAEKKNKAVAEIEQQRQRRDALLAVIPTGPERTNVVKYFNEWKIYYTTRAAQLENTALSLPARMQWLSHTPEDVIKAYFDIIDALLKSEDENERRMREEKLHQVENEMESIVSAESARIRAKHPTFFK